MSPKATEGVVSAASTSSLMKKGVALHAMRFWPAGHLPLEGGDQQLHRCLHPSIHCHGFHGLEGRQRLRKDQHRCAIKEQSDTRQLCDPFP